MAVWDWSGASLPWFEEPSALKERVGNLFRCAEPRQQLGLLLEGLIGGAERKNNWQLVEYVNDSAPWRMQALLGRTVWDQEKAWHLPELCDRASWRSMRRPGFGRDGILEERQSFGWDCVSMQRHGRTDREL